MRKETDFIVRTYKKSDLAHLYNPDTSILTALQLLKKWIRANEGLSCALAATGLKSTAKLYTPKQVELIVEYLGEP